MVWPVDQPTVLVETVSKIVSVYENEKKALTIPRYQKRKGHPVIYSSQAMQAALNLESQQTGKDLQTMFAGQTSFVDVQDPGILTDIDTPEDYEKYVSPS
jgi:molybdenum cofactor cytidylyltransferase